MAPTTNVLTLAQRLAEAVGSARSLIHGTPAEIAVQVEGLRRWYHAQPPPESDRLLWRRFAAAEHQIKVRIWRIDDNRSGRLFGTKIHQLFLQIGRQFL